MRAGRLALVALAAASLLAGIAGGLMRLGVPLTVPVAAASHAALMVGGFLGTVISLERAVAMGVPLAYGAPLASGLAGVLTLAGLPLAATPLALLAPALLFAVSVAIVRRQRALHTVLLAAAAVAWGIGNTLLVGGFAHLAPAWWFTFLVLTIAAERLEMTRLMKRRALARPLFLGIVAVLVGGAALPAFAPSAGAAAFGLALVALAGWLAVFDIARRTVRASSYPRYAAIALLAGYGWLAVGGMAWAAAPFVQAPLRDAALHSLGLGFVFSMIFAHAPIIVPVVARVRLTFTPAFYVPLALLHASLLVRLVAGFGDPRWRLAGGLLNAAAVAVFAVTLAVALAREARVVTRE